MENVNRKLKRRQLVEAPQPTAPYACVNWECNDSEDGCDKDDLKIWLQEEATKVNQNCEKVKDDMRKTYSLQRQNINACMKISEIFKEWPFLRQIEYFLDHYTKLLGLDDTTEGLAETFRTKGFQMYR